MKNTMNIAFSINKPHLFFAFVTINSILNHNPNSFFNIYILQDTSILPTDPDKFINALHNHGKNNFNIQLIDVTKHPKFNQINHSVEHWGKEIFYKVLLPSLLPKLDRILALDTDVIINGDITDIYNTFFSNSYFGADKLQTGWFNVGILLCNLANIRKDNIENKWLEYITTMQKNEEVIVNKKFKEKSVILQNCYTIWDIQKPISSIEFSQTKIIHLVARKPWIMPSSRHFGLKIKILWNKSVTPFIKPYSKLSFYLIKFYGVYLNKYLYALTKKTPLGKTIYKSAYTLLKKVII